MAEPRDTDGIAGEPLEIERKFVVRMPDPDALSGIDGHRATWIRQTYVLAGDEGETRVREVDGDGGRRFLVTTKIDVPGGDGTARIEREREVDEAEAAALLASPDPRRLPIEKIRHSFPHAGHVMELDAYPQDGEAAILEVELASADEPLDLPPLIEVIGEVTGERAFRNSSLAEGFPEDGLAGLYARAHGVGDEAAGDADPDAPPRGAIDYGSELNERQLEAAMHMDGPLLVLAGAGSGKTRTLVFRVMHLVESGVPAERILLLTFTNKAADEMRDRTVSLLDERCAGVVAMTYHSFCAQVLREHGSLVGLDGSYTILSPTDVQVAIGIVRPRLFELDSFPPGYPNDNRLAAIFSAATNRDMTIQEVLERDGNFSQFSKFARFPDIVESMARIRDAYTAYKAERSMVDYDDLMVLTWRLLCENPGVCAEVAGRFDHIMVDEYQDTNALQDKIVFMLRQECPNLVVVGDDYQSIYRFRGSDVTNILRFPAKARYLGTPDAARLHELSAEIDAGAGALAGAGGKVDAGALDGVTYLDANYRSDPQIVALANAVMDANAGFGFAKDMVSQDEDGCLPTLVSLASQASEADFALAEVRRLHDEEGLRYGQIAVLSRTAAAADMLVRLVDRAGIPRRRYGGKDLLTCDFGNDAVARLRVLVNPRDELAWHKVIRKFPQVGEGHAATVVHAVSRDPSFAFLGEGWWPRCSALEDLERLRGECAAMAAAGWPGAIDAVCDACREHAYEDLDRESRAYYRDDPIGAEQRIRDAEREMRAAQERLREIARATSSAKEMLDALSLGEVDASLSAETPGDAGDEGCLTISTVHSVKGLEFEAVIILDCVDRVFPSVRRDEIGGEADMEELRCFYVACTRARRHLTLCAPRLAKVGKSTMRVVPSHYLDAIGDDLLLRTEA